MTNLLMLPRRLLGYTLALIAVSLTGIARMMLFASAWLLDIEGLE